MEEDTSSDCELLVVEAIKSSPLVNTLIKALENSGCYFYVERHISCEPCGKGLAGAFDKKLNQIVICDNYCKDLESVRRTLSHELVHMYDYCSKKVYFHNLQHLACTEIRAANLADCKSPFSSVLIRQSSLSFFGEHEKCVKSKAASSVRIIAGVSQDSANQAVDSVFTKCYSDLEPIGRQCSGYSDEMRAYKDYDHFFR